MAEIVYAGLTAVAIMIVVALALTAIAIAWNAAESSPSNLDDELVSKKQVEAPESTNSTLAT
jgi:sensor domain CHASE-containing protein